MTRVLVCGSRDWDAGSPIAAILNGYLLTGPLTVIEGGALGADRLARKWAEDFARFGVTHQQFPADWGTNGKAAGPIRNGQMLRDGKPDVVWAFTSKPLAQSRGTADMVKRAKAAGIPTYVVSQP